LVPRIVYVESNGCQHGTDVAVGVGVGVGVSVMRGAIDAGIPGIDAVCGGQCVCATCHCTVDAAWFGMLPGIAELEEELLDGVTAGRSPHSRLSCQIEMTEELDGLIVHMPHCQ
jgi:2Fe-2S ferredoxin